MGDVSKADGVSHRFFGMPNLLKRERGRGLCQKGRFWRGGSGSGFLARYAAPSCLQIGAPVLNCAPERRFCPARADTNLAHLSNWALQGGAAQSVKNFFILVTTYLTNILV